MKQTEDDKPHRERGRKRTEMLKKNKISMVFRVQEPTGWTIVHGSGQTSSKLYLQVLPMRMTPVRHLEKKCKGKSERKAFKALLNKQFYSKIVEKEKRSRSETDEDSLQEIKIKESLTSKSFCWLGTPLTPAFRKQRKVDLLSLRPVWST